MLAILVIRRIMRIWLLTKPGHVRVQQLAHQHNKEGVCLQFQEGTEGLNQPSLSTELACPIVKDKLEETKRLVKVFLFCYFFIVSF